MVEIPSWQNCGWNWEIKPYVMVGLDCFQEYKRKKFFTDALRVYCVENVLKENSSQNNGEHIDESSICNADVADENISRNQKLNSICQMCLESHSLGDHLSLNSPKNFVVQYFTMSRNHPIKVCYRPQCPFSGHGLRTHESKQPSVCLELPRCKDSQMTAQDQASHCANPLNDIDRTLSESMLCSNLLKKTDDWHQDRGVPCFSSRKGCSSIFSSDSPCALKTSAVESLRVKNKCLLQQTEPEQSWQTRCSNFITNLPVTLSDKLFGPRTTCEALKDNKRTICGDDSMIKKSQPVPEKTSTPGSRDQGNKKSVKTRVSSLADCNCHKNIETEKVFLEKANQVDPCYVRTSQSIQKGVPCGRFVQKSERDTTTCKKVTSKSGKSCEGSFGRLEISENYSDNIHSRRSEPREPRLKREARNKTCLSISEEDNRRKTSPCFSNWPTILLEKFLGPRNEKVLRCCDVANEVKHAKATDGVVDSREIVSEVGSPSATKKGRLVLKKYTVSQTPETMEETLCFDILVSEQLHATRTKLHSQACAKTTSCNQRKLETIRERNEVLNKCLRTGGSYTSKQCIKSKRNVSESRSRKMKQLEKKTSIEHVFLASLITKFLNRQRDVNDVCNKKKCDRNSESGQNRNERDQHERKCVFKYRANTVSPKCATTGIRKYRKKYVTCPRYIGKNSRKTKPKNVSLDCSIVDFPIVSGRDQTQRKISNDISSGSKEVSEGNMRTYHSPDNLENETDLCKKVTQIMTHGRTDRLKNELSNEKECQGCDSCGSSKVKSRVKPDVLQVIDESCRRDSKEFCRIELHREKRKAKSDVREKFGKEIPSRKKFAYSFPKRNGIEYNNLQLAFRGRQDGEMMPQQKETSKKGICTHRHRDISVSKKGFGNCDALTESKSLKLENYRKNHLFFSRIERRSKKRCHPEQLPMARFHKRLVIRENEISDSRKDRIPQFLVEGTRRTFVIAGENICIKMFHDRETCTDDWPGSGHYRNSKYLEEQRQNRESLYTRTPLGEIKNVMNCSLSWQKAEQNSIANVIRNSESQNAKRGPIEFYPQSRSLEELPLLNEHGNSSMQKQPENGMRIRVGCEECVGLPARNDACWVRPGGILEGEDILEAEQDVGKVFSSRQQARGEYENTVCENKTCLYKALIKSETKEATGIWKEDEFCQKQSIAVESSLKINNCSPSLMATQVCNPEEKGGSRGDSTTETGDKNEHTNDNRQLLKACPRKSKRVDGDCLKMSSSGKQSSWIKSPEKDLDVTKPKSRNIINSYYYQRKSVVTSRHEARNNERAKVKRGKVQRDGNASEKSIIKARKPFQQIENVRQVGCSANGVIKDDKGKKREAIEKDNSIMNEKSQYTEDEGVFHNDAKDYLVRNTVIDNSSLPNDSTAIMTDSNTLSIQKLTETNSVNPEMHTTTSKIPKKSRLPTKNKTPERVLTSAIKAPESSSVKLKMSSRKSWLKQRNSGVASSQTDAKRTAKEAGKIAEHAKSESSNRLTRSIDACNMKGSERHKELKTPACIFDKENVRARTLQIVMSSVEEQNTPSDAISKGTNWITKGHESKKYSKSSNLLRNGERGENDRSCNSVSAKEPKGNKQTKRNQSKSETASKKNEKGKKSTPLKLSMQTGSEIDVSSSTQENFTTNADLFADALMDGKNNIKSYHDLQSATEENFHPHRISASKDKSLRKSSKSSKTTAKPTSDKSKNDENLRNLRANASKITETVNASDKDRLENISITSSASIHIKNTNEGPTTDSGVNTDYVTANSLSVEVSNAQANRSSTCKKSNLKKNSVALADYNFEKSCTTRTVENAVLPKDIANEKPPVCTSNKQPSHEEVLDKFRVSPYHTKNGTPTSSSRTSSDSEHNSTKAKKLCKGFQNPSTNKKQIVQYNNVPDRLTTSWSSERIISDSSDRNSCFTDDLKRLLDQGQKFFTLKSRKNSNQTTSCFDGKQNLPPCGSCKSKVSEASCNTTELYKSINYEKVPKSLKICDEDEASSNSISSLQKAYSTLKTILNKTRSSQKSFMSTKQTKETQISTPILDESSTRIVDCIKPHENIKSP